MDTLLVFIPRCSGLHKADCVLQVWASVKSKLLALRWMDELSPGLFLHAMAPLLSEHSQDFPQPENQLLCSPGKATSHFWVSGKPHRGDR